MFIIFPSWVYLVFRENMHLESLEYYVKDILSPFQMLILLLKFETPYNDKLHFCFTSIWNKEWNIEVYDIYICIYVYTNPVPWTRTAVCKYSIGSNEKNKQGW